MTDHKDIKTIETNKQNALSSLTLDVSRYDQFLEECDWSEEQKAQFLNSLWHIVVTFVDLGFGMDATQAACGKLLKSAFENMFEGSDDVKSNLSHHHEKHEDAKDSEAEGVPS